MTTKRINKNNENNNTDVNDIPNNTIVSPSVKRKNYYNPAIIGVTILTIAIISIILISSHSNSKNDGKLPDRSSLFTELFDFTSPVKSVSDINDILNIFYKAGNLTGSFTIDNLSSNEDISGTTFNYLISHNIATESASVSADLTYRNARLYGFSSFIDSQKLMFKIPSFSESVYTFSDKLFTSALFSDTDIFSRYVYAIKETYPSDYKNILSGISSVSSANDAYGNKGITYTIDEESVKLFIIKLFDTAFDNKDLISYTNPDYSKTDSSDISKQFTSFGELLSDLYSGDIQFTVWKNEKGQLTNFVSNNTISIYKYDINLDFSIESYGTENPSDSMTFILSISLPENTYDFIYDRTIEYDNNITYYNHKFDVTSHNGYITDSILDMDISESFDSDSYDYTLEIIINSGLYDINDTILTMSGRFQNIKKNNSFDFTFSKVQITYGYYNHITLSGDLSVNTAKPNITSPSGSKVDINSLSANEKEELIYRIYNFFAKFA